MKPPKPGCTGGMTTAISNCPKLINLLPPASCARFIKQPRAERNFLRHGLAFENFQRCINRLRPTGGILECGVQDSLLHISDAFLWQRVNSNEEHPFLASG